MAVARLVREKGCNGACDVFGARRLGGQGWGRPTKKDQNRMDQA